MRYDTDKIATMACRRARALFLACSFWLADAYVLLGRARRARAAVRAAARRCATTSACSSEEYDPRASGCVGNFPQAFSHVALVNTAFNLTRATKPAEQRADHSAAAR